MRISDFIEKSNESRSPDDLAALFKRALAEDGFEGFAYGAMTNAEAHNLDGPQLLVDYPSAWVEHYFRQGYLRVDPIVTHTPFMRRPFQWSELKDLTEQQRTVIGEAGEAGLRQGFCVPIHGPFGDVFAMSITTSQTAPQPLNLRDKLHVLSVQFHTSFSRLTDLRPLQTPPVHLTERERECLLWSARGKSSWDTGEILSLSEHTVNFHIKNAMAKLVCTSRIMAIVKAIRLGLIVP